MFALQSHNMFIHVLKCSPSIAVVVCIGVEVYVWFTLPSSVPVVFKLCSSLSGNLQRLVGRVLEVPQTPLPVAAQKTTR